MLPKIKNNEQKEITMRENIRNMCDYLCDLCIQAMRYFSSVSGMSYEEVNILVLLGPLATILFAVALLFALYNKKKNAIYISIPAVLIAISVFLISAWCVITVIMNTMK